MKNIDKIYASTWWKNAKQYPDRHYDKDSGIMLSDHLQKVADNLSICFDEKPYNDFYSNLYIFLEGYNINTDEMKEVLLIVALLHDIGKTVDDKTIEVEHPLSKKKVKKRHNVVGIEAAIQILDDSEKLSKKNKEIIYNLIDDHDTPYGWYCQYKKSGVIPKTKSWEKLSFKIDDTKNGNITIGIILLAVIKIADIDGHDRIDDVVWFIEQLNINYLREKGVFFPIPRVEDICNS